MTDQEVIEIIKQSRSYSEVCRKLGQPIGGAYFKRINRFIQQNNIDCSHFGKSYKYQKITKQCPVCKKDFVCQSGGKNNKTTCSHSCSNSFFRTKHHNGRYVDGRTVWRGYYRTVCLNHYGHKCLLCDWDKNVDVHHVNGDHSDDRLENLVPLCPNHHRMTTTKKYKEEIDALIEKAKNEFKQPEE